MILSELMANYTPDPEYDGPQTANDMVLAVNFGQAGADPGTFALAQPYITEHSGAINSSTQETEYIRTGPNTTRTGASRVITVNGDNKHSDEFQDGIKAHEILYGTGGTVIKEYVYFSLLTGKGERGRISIDVTADHEGVAGENDSFSATLTSDATPQEYTYTPTP